MANTPKRPRDMMQLAKLVGDIATGQAQDDAPSPPTPQQERASKGGRARAQKLTRAKRVAIARKGVIARRKRR